MRSVCLRGGGNTRTASRARRRAEAGRRAPGCARTPALGGAGAPIREGLVEAVPSLRRHRSPLPPSSPLPPTSLVSPSSSLALSPSLPPSYHLPSSSPLPQLSLLAPSSFLPPSSPLPPSALLLPVVPTTHVAPSPFVAPTTLVARTVLSMMFPALLPSVTWWLITDALPAHAAMPRFFLVLVCVACSGEWTRDHQGMYRRVSFVTRPRPVLSLGMLCSIPFFSISVRTPLHTIIRAECVSRGGGDVGGGDDVGDGRRKGRLSVLSAPLAVVRGRGATL